MLILVEELAFFSSVRSHRNYPGASGAKAATVLQGKQGEGDQSYISNPLPACQIISLIFLSTI